MQEERSPHPGNPLHPLGDQPGQGASAAQRREQPAGLQQAAQIKTSTDSPGHLVALCSLDAHLLEHVGPGAETWASADGPRERTGVGCTEIAQRGWSVVQAATRGVRRTEYGLVTEALLLTCTPRGGGTLP